MNRAAIEMILINNLDNAKAAFNASKEEFRRLTGDVPSGIPHPDGTDRLRNFGVGYALAFDTYSRALKEFNDFLLHGIVPERLKSPDEKHERG